MDETQFFSMPPGSIIPGRLGRFSIYLKPAGHRSPVLFTKAGETIDAQILERLEEMDVREVYIRTDERVNFNKYIEDNLQEILSNEKMGVDRRAEVFARISIHIITDAFSCSGKGLDRHFIRRVETFVTQTSSFLTDTKTLPVLSKMVGHDYSTYRHSMLVYWYTMALLDVCRDILPGGIEADAVESFLIQGGVSALLHDIGKVMISSDILNKPGPLTPIEFQIIKTHPVNALALLLDTELEAAICRAILHHHEDVNGKGYPFRLKGTDIPFLSRVIRIVDVFEAMTSNRPYKPASPPDLVAGIMLGQKNAVKKLEDETDKVLHLCFDRDILDRFLMLLKEKIY